MHVCPVLSLRTSIRVGGARPRRVVPVIVSVAAEADVRRVLPRQFVPRNSSVGWWGHLRAVCCADTRSRWAVPVVAGERAEACLVGVARVGAEDADGSGG